MPPRKHPPALKTAALRALIGLLTYHIRQLSDLEDAAVADDAEAAAAATESDEAAATESDEAAARGLALGPQVRVVMSTSARRHGRRLRWLHDCVSAVPEANRGDVVRAGLQCADVFLSYRNNHPACRALDRLLAALLPDTVRRLSLSDAQSYPLREAVVRRLQALPQLRELTLAESLHLHTRVDAVLAAVGAGGGAAGLRHLAVVRAPWLCSDALAAALAAACPSLDLLDASESARLSDRGVAALARGCPRLRALLLSGCGVSEAGYARLLAALPGLLRVGRCPALGAVVRAASATLAAGEPPTPAEPAKTLALTEWDSDEPPDSAEAALCPGLRSVSLCDVRVDPLRDGHGEHGVEAALLPAGVERLCVRWVGLRDHAAHLPLQLPAALTHLDFMDSVVSVADAVELGRQCPSLRVLKVASMEAAAGVVPAAPRAPREPREPRAPFARLEEFHLYSGPGSLLEYVLAHARALVRVSVTPGAAADDGPAWTDACMRRVLDANPLAELVSLGVACRCALTMESVYLLLLSCPKLRALFDLAEWDVSEEQLSQLEELAVANNWDLELGLARL